MNTMKHTAGKWATSLIDNHVIIGRGGIVIANASQYTKTGHLSYEESDANAKLIAAAPCLLEALIKMIDHAQEQHPHFESERGMADINRSIQAVEKGLAIKWGDVRLEQ